MRQHRIIYSETARADIIAIREQIRKAAELIAGRFVGRIVDAIESRAFLPTRHRIRSELAADLRAIGIRKYLVFYRVVDDEVLIVRVLHGARNITTSLFAS